MSGATKTETGLSGTGTAAWRNLWPKLQERLSAQLLGLVAAGAMVFLYLPIVVLMVFSFNDNRSLTWPLRGFTLRWYESFLNNADMLAAIKNSLYVASMATCITVVVGTTAAMVLDRIAFPGKTVFRRLVLLPLGAHRHRGDPGLRAPAALQPAPRGGLQRPRGPALADLLSGHSAQHPLGHHRQRALVLHPVVRRDPGHLLSDR
jgi:hypothetical protein